MLDRKQVVGVVMAHAKAEATVARHMPYWLMVCDWVHVWVPDGQAFAPPMAGCSVHACVPDGGSYSLETTLRFELAMKEALNAGKPYVLLMEYDSLCWGPIPDTAIPRRGGMGGCVFPNESTSPVPGLRFKAPFYIHFPQLYSYHGLLALHRTMEQMDPNAEHGYSDRFIGMAAHLARLPVLDYRTTGLAYSWANISGHRHRIRQCMEAVKQGAVFSHGIKDASSLEQIMAVAPFGQ